MTKKKNSGDLLWFPPRSAHKTRSEHGKKLSEIVEQMAMQLLKNLDARLPGPAAMACLMLTMIAWNSTLDKNMTNSQLRQLIEDIKLKIANPWAEMRSNDPEYMIAELAKYKRAHYADDLRRIFSVEITLDNTVRVHWTEPEKIVRADFGGADAKAGSLKARRGRPIADKLVKKMGLQYRGKVVDLMAIKAGRKDAEELQKTVASRQDLATNHPAHAVYVYAQNQVSVMVERLSELKELELFVKIVCKAEDEYLPSGPPMSPLTYSFFSCWSFFDVCVGLAAESFGTTVMAVGSAFGMHEELVRVIGLMQESRMGVYVHEGIEKDSVVLRELVTERVCRAIVPSGYRGKKGELWYARVLPPPFPGSAEHVVFTTPYVLLSPGEREWQAYFRRNLPDAPEQARLRAYARHMKLGPTRAYWNEFVFEAYVNYQTEAIFLAGLPDVAESRPHSPAHR